MKRVLTTAILCAAIVGLAACTTDGSGSTDASGRKNVEVGMINSGPPFEYMDKGQLTGFEVELLSDVAKKENWNVSYKYMNFDAMIPALQSHTVDAAAGGFFITPERKKAISFSNSYYSDGNELVVSKGSEIKSPEMLKGKKIVAKKGASSAAAAQKVADQYGASVILLPDEPSMFLALSNGTADALVDDSAVIAYKEKTDGTELVAIKQLDETPVGLAFQKNSKLVEGFNQALTQLKSDGTLAKLKTKYQMN
ncbi:transporter substrate-binding domain-containing protein [Gordonia sp. DT30]|uniref:ABC transporter substrate-binding protein n=1 Tax=Gordonia sp. DT30 TaxID=3416546 RepID=UPI003CE6CEEB